MLLWHVFLLASVSIAQPVGVPTSATIVTPLDYFDSGRRQVDAYLDRSDLLRGTKNAMMERCARIEVRYAHTPDAYRSVLGSGVLLGDERHVLTAGHMFDGFERGDIRVTFPSGEVLLATVVNHRYEIFGADWAILALYGTAPLVDGLETAVLSAGSLAFVFGYPDHIGVDSRGRLVFGESSTRFLEPIVTLGTVSGTDPLTLDPHVGAVPTEGMSGGPVFDAHGRLVGILVSVSREPGAESRYHYRIIPVAGVPEIAGMTPPFERAASTQSSP